jgi:hypothetical protein
MKLRHVLLLALLFASLLQTHQVSLGLRELLKPAATHRLGELLKLYGREDLVTSVDEVGIEEFLEIKYLCMGGIARNGADDRRARSQASSSDLYIQVARFRQSTKHLTIAMRAYHG